jgi:acyl dehydratase
MTHVDTTPQMTVPPQVDSPNSRSGHQPDGEDVRSGMKYWEDLAHAPVRRFGPLVFTGALLDHLLDLMGEKHPIHDDAEFASSVRQPGRIVPGGFIHSVTSGWTVRHGAPAAIIGMRSMHWTFVRPLPLDTEFYFTTESVGASAVDKRVGLVETVRKVMDADSKTYAIGRMSVVVLRRPHPARNAPPLQMATDLAPAAPPAPDLARGKDD